MHEEDIERDKLCMAVVVGEVKQEEYLDKIKEICDAEGVFECVFKYLGGLQVMLVFKNTEAVHNIVHNLEHGIRRWIDKIRK